MKLKDIVRGTEKTTLLYLKDSYATKFQGRLLKTVFDGKSKVYLVLNQTLFHPKGGGQLTDKGHIYNNTLKIQIKKAIYVNGVVVHWGKLLNGQIKNDTICGKIDWERRYQYMKRHTAGHLLDHCLTLLTGKPVETTNSWLGDPCFVEYKGKTLSDQVLISVEKMINELICKGAKVIIETVSQRELYQMTPNAPNIQRLPLLTTYRLVTIEGCNPIPCLGTHLRNINKIGRVVVKRVEATNRGYRIYYVC